MAGNDHNQGGSGAGSASDAANKASAAARDIGHQATSAANDYRDAAANAAKNLGEQASNKASDLQDQAGSVADQLKDKANEQIGSARNLVSNIANEARSKVAEIVDQQKNAGADKLTGFSRAAESAAGELEQQNPQVARIVRDAASTVDHLAGDLRSSELGDVVASISNFARAQPVAFFAASVLAGFVLARFVKSEPVAAPSSPPSRRIAGR